MRSKNIKGYRYEARGVIKNAKTRSTCFWNGLFTIIILPKRLFETTVVRAWKTESNFCSDLDPPNLARSAKKNATFLHLSSRGTRFFHQIRCVSHGKHTEKGCSGCLGTIHLLYKTDFGDLRPPHPLFSLINFFRPYVFPYRSP